MATNWLEKLNKEIQRHRTCLSQLATKRETANRQEKKLRMLWIIPLLQQVHDHYESGPKSAAHLSFLPPSDASYDDWVDECRLAAAGHTTNEYFKVLVNILERFGCTVSYTFLPAEGQLPALFSIFVRSPGFSETQ